MFFRLPRFIRRWMRRRMHPMAENKAWSIKTKLSVAYMLIAWNALGLVVYQIHNGHLNWPVSFGLITQEESDLRRPAYNVAKALGIRKAEVYSLSSSRGLSEKVDFTVKVDEAPPAPAKIDQVPSNEN